jgi:hypothetical protein
MILDDKFNFTLAVVLAITLSNIFNKHTLIMVFLFWFRKIICYHGEQYKHQQASWFSKALISCIL